MNLRDLQYLVAVAKFRHFGKAAENCHVSQPSLSAQIKKLEEYLGVELLERTNKRVMVTPVGEEVLQHARTILQHADEIREIGRQASDPSSGVFRLGIIPTIAPYLLPRLMPLLEKHFPKLELELYEGQTHQIVQQIKQGELDAILLALPIEDDQLEEHHLFKERFYVATPDDHPLAEKSYIEVRDLRPYPLLLLEDGHCLRDQALDVCQLAGTEEYSHFRATSLETIRHMVAHHAGITLLPEMATRDHHDNIALVPFKPPAPHRDIGLCWRRSSPRKELLRDICTTIKEHDRTLLGKKG